MQRIETANMTYEPWTNGYAVGFRCIDPQGRVSYVYLNPSNEDSEGAPNVFMYRGAAGDPAEDAPVIWTEVTL